MEINNSLIKNGYFPDEMEIWVVTEYIQNKEIIEEGFNKKCRFIKNLDDFIAAVEKCPQRNGCPYASVIVYKGLPKGVKEQADQIEKILNLLPAVAVYEVERENQSFSKSFVYGSVNGLFKVSKGLARTQYIMEIPDEDKQGRILKQLDDELAIMRTEREKLERNIISLEQEVNNKNNKIKDLEAQIDLEINTLGQQKEDEIHRLKKRLNELEVELESERQKLLEYKTTNAKLNEVVIDNKYEIEVLKTKVDKMEYEVQLKEQDVESKERTIRQQQRDIADLTLAGAKGIQYEKLLDKQRALEEEISTKNKALEYAKLECTSMRLDKEKLQDTVELLRKGSVAQSVLGRTTILDHWKLNTTDLVYIKVFQELPYHKLACKLLFEKLNVIYGGSARLCIIKQDDGSLNKIEQGIPLYSSLEEVPIKESIFRLHPSTSMFTGGKEYEKYIECLFVIEYMVNDDYLVETNGLSNVMTMVRRPEDIAKYGLTGLPLTLGPRSVFDLTYDPIVARSGIKENRRLTLNNKVDKWLDKIKTR